MAIENEVGRVRSLKGGGRFIVENSLVGSHASNGFVERVTQSVAAQVRVMLDVLETKWNFEIPCSYPIIGFVVEHAGFLLNRYEVGMDGRIAFLLCKRKRARTAGIEFGESVVWKKTHVGGALGKLFSS